VYIYTTARVAIIVFILFTEKIIIKNIVRWFIIKKILLNV